MNMDADSGPIGALGESLTAERSIAVRMEFSNTGRDRQYFCTQRILKLEWRYGV
jgi:hypothetical protein